MAGKRRTSRIASLRAAFGWSQSTLSRLVGVHSLTVSKWERDTLSPAPFQSGLLEVFAAAATRVGAESALALGREAAQALVVSGTPYALYLVLKVRYA